MRKRRLLIPLLLLLVGLLAVPSASQAVTVGIGDEQPSMFASPFYQQLHPRIARLIVPYDAVDVSIDRTLADQWLAAARASGVQPLVAFYHSRVTAERMPSVHRYQLEVKKFMQRYPDVKLYQPWNEANRGNVRGLFKSPTAKQAAQYYLALKSVCHSCRNVGLDVLDGANIRPTIRYIRSFQSAVRSLHGKLPTIWGLHNYSDTNRFRDTGTRAVLAAVKGQVWLTETGGVVQFGGAFPNRNGEGLTRASRALEYMFTLAKRFSSRVTRLYIFQWTGSSSDVRFDAGLLDKDGRTPRPGYSVVCRHLGGARCSF